MPSYTTPYTPQSVGLSPYQRGSLGELLQQRGDIQARAQLAKGQAWANAIANIGQTVSGAISDYSAQKQAKQEAAAKAEAERPAREAAALKLRLENDKLQREGQDAIQAKADKSAIAGAMLTPSRQAAREALKDRPDLLQEVEKHWQEKDQIHGTLLAKSARAIAGNAYSPEIALSELDDYSQNYGNSPEIEQMREAIKADPANIKTYTDRILLKYGDDKDREMLKPQEVKPDTRSLEVRFADAVSKGDTAQAKTLEEAIRRASAAGRAPEKPDAPIYREIEGKTYEMRGGKAIPVSVPGQEGPVSPAEASFVAQPAFKKLPPAAKTQVVKAAELINTAKEYRKLVLDNVNESGLLLSGPMAAEINSAHGNLAFKGAGGYGQGALQAPDREVMEEIFTNPASLSPSAIAKTSIRGGKQGIKQSLDRAVKRLEDDLFRVYGLKLEDVTPLENGTRVPAPSKAPIKVGKYTIEVEG